ncbi:hypothetical protein CXG81DRAFT_17219 [Caulochytrium protostelioides]|uniref:CsbD-like domain-containing protein n=1 Tax=Caulochytrium protostelioides TaxID=1555241 RepID=A0A4P9XCJ9_9FUNG|nr:hypothetical protein CXG81DRAFT_17219 [Caulochytrium protostelioides]|eukprot:RKP03153.1 hypothetical protein CXG81DRAFT_17219 [Caulochytrium protostelioides]
MAAAFTGVGDRLMGATKEKIGRVTHNPTMEASGHVQHVQGVVAHDQKKAVQNARHGTMTHGTATHTTTTHAVPGVNHGTTGLSHGVSGMVHGPPTTGHTRF